MFDKWGLKMNKSEKVLTVFVGLIVSQLFFQVVSADTTYRVKSSDNLNKIAEREYEGSGLTNSQILVGLYASNPKAFKNGNINKLLRGKKLVLPDVSKIDQISHQEAELVLSARTKSKKIKKRRTKKRTKSKRKSKTRRNLAKNNLSSSQIKNAQKIDKLEKESESLRKRLDALLAQKSASDNKLNQLENSLEAALKKSAAAASSAAIMTNNVSTGAGVNEPGKKPQQEVNSTDEVSGVNKSSKSESELITQRANENLREANVLLEKNLQESKKENAERTRVSLAKEHALKAEQADSNVSTGSQTFDTSNKYLQWALLSLLLFPLIWFAKRMMGAKKAKEQPAWVTESEGQNGVLGAGSEQIDTYYQEAPVESSIKLDVASAYLESGNMDEAMELLNEILLEGNAEQQAQAQNLLNRYS